MDPAQSVLTSFRYADNKPYVVSKKAIETSNKVLKDLDTPEVEPPNPKDQLNAAVAATDWDEEDEEDEVGQENKEDDIEWSGDEAELSREISILEQSITSKREHSPTKSPRKKKPY